MAYVNGSVLVTEVFFFLIHCIRQHMRTSVTELTAGSMSTIEGVLITLLKCSAQR